MKKRRGSGNKWRAPRRTKGAHCRSGGSGVPTLPPPRFVEGVRGRWPQPVAQRC
ncbi:unnamed protein product [Ixodes pacificus]